MNDPRFAARVMLASTLCALGLFATSDAMAQPNVSLQQRTFVLTQPDGTRVEVPVIRTSNSAVDYYDFRSASSHMGIEEVRKGFILFHHDVSQPDVPISLIMTFGIDRSTTGISQPTARVDLDISGVPVTTTVELSDDGGEFTKPDSTSARGRWRFANNTDGGILGAFPDDTDWEVTLDFDDSTLSGIDNIYYYDETGAFTEVDVSLPLTLTYDALPAASTYDIEATVGRPVEICGTISSANSATSTYTFTWEANTFNPTVRTGMTTASPEIVCDTFTFNADGDFTVELSADDGVGVGTSTISVRVRPACGDGFTDPNQGEACDDGNTTSGDGCSATCSSEFAWTCSRDDSILTNPGFELPVISGTSSPVDPDGWTSFDDGVDIHRTNITGDGIAPEGAQLVDLNKLDQGGLYQDISTVAGQRYTILFRAAYNNVCNATGASAQVTAADSASPDEPHTRRIFSTDTDFNNLAANWETYEFTFEATSATTRLAFDAMQPGGACGFSIDEVLTQNSTCALDDEDMDGVPTLLEDRNGNGDPTDDDTDGDTIPDYLDPDDDNDGVNTIDEDVDMNGDPTDDDDNANMVPDYLDPCAPDANNILCLDGDLDMDGLTNGEELNITGTNPALADSDGDGVRDDVEVGPDINNPIDTDMDMTIDALDADDDGDGVNTIDEDLDSSGDPRDDDSDGDLIPDYLDADDDGDGTLSIDEPGDADNSNTPDRLEPCTPDADAVACPTGDADGDGTDNDNDIDPLDPCVPDADALACDSGDADMDGISNGDERNITGTDPTIADTDMDGIPDGVEVGNDIANPRNTDGDMLIDALDADDDNDGVNTIDEDANMNGDPTDDDVDMNTLPDYLDACYPDPASDACGAGDPDMDGVPNDMDPDPLDPCVPNADALACDSGDTDMDGVNNGDERDLGLDPTDSDSDGDGVPDGVEVTDVNDPTDTDMDNTIDALDPDDDGDGILTSLETYDGNTDPRDDDTDMDTVPDYLDADDDGDDTPTASENPDPNGDGDPEDAVDTNMDGLPDYLDPTTPGEPVELAITSPRDGATVGVDVVVVGQAAPGEEVEVFVDGESVGTTTAGADGNWSLDVTLDPGARVITATSDSGGMAGPVNVTVDAGQTGGVTITSPTDGQTLDMGTFTVSGRAEAGAEVEILLDGAIVATATADADGNWSAEITAENGDHTLEARSGESSSDEIAITVDDGTMGGEIAVSVTSPSAGETVSSKPVISGTATPGAEITISIDGEEVGTTTADDQGEWSYEVADALEDGAHTLEVTATSEGNTASTGSIDFESMAGFVDPEDPETETLLVGGCSQTPGNPSTPSLPLLGLLLAGLGIRRRIG